MNILLLTTHDLINDNEVVISDRRFEHLKKILKAKAGDKIDLGLLNGKLGFGEIISMDKESAKIAVRLNNNPPAPMPITLILALPRPLMLKRILQSVTSIGVKEVHLINSQRVEKSYWSSSDLAEEVIYHQLILGLEQSRDTQLPSIFFNESFKKFTDINLPDIIKNKQALLAHPGNYPPCPSNIQKSTVLAVGPEGGFIADEVASFTHAGFQAVQIGDRPLRVESAVTALLGRLLPV